MVTVSIVFAETFSLLARKRNRSDIDLLSFVVLPVEDSAVYAAIPLIEQHNINTSDAMMLVQYLRYLGSQANAKGVLVASDARLLRAAQEGFGTIDPEKISAAGLAAFLANL